MFELEGLNKDTVYNLMEELLYSFNYMLVLFKGWVRRKHPEEFKSEEFCRLYEKFGSYQAKRLSKALDISAQGVDILIQLLKHSHWAVFENIEVKKLTEKSFRMRTIECSLQRAAERRETGYYDCRLVGSLLRSGFFKRVDQNVRVQRIFTPPEIKPEGTPENVSCEWLISVEEK